MSKFILPEFHLMIDLGYGISLVHVKRVTSSIYDLIYAEVLTPELDRQLPVTYNVGDDNTILHDWYKLDDDLECDFIREAVRQYFNACRQAA